MKGKLIVFEGINGAGKDVQTNLLNLKMEAEGYNTFVTRNPTSNLPVGSLMRKEYLTGNRLHDNEMLALLLAADRYEQCFMKGGIKDKLDEGFHVICSRFYLSSLAYQGYIDEMHTNILHIIDLNKEVIDRFVPDITIYLDLNPELVPERVKLANERVDINENIERAFLSHKGYANAIVCRSAHPSEHIYIIPADNSIEDIHNAVWALVEPILKS